MYRSYSYNSMPQPVNTHRSDDEPKKTQAICNEKQELVPPALPESSEHTCKNSSELPFGLEKDDIILIIIIAILLFNDCDDTLLLLALAYIFFADYFKF